MLFVGTIICKNHLKRFKVPSEQTFLWLIFMWFLKICDMKFVTKKQNWMLRVFHKCHQVIYLKIDWFDNSNWNRTLTSIVKILLVAGRQHCVCECFGWFYISNELHCWLVNLLLVTWNTILLHFLHFLSFLLKDALWKKQVNVSAFLLLLMALL